MKYSVDKYIELPRLRVVELFDNPENLKEWQKGLVECILTEGEAGKKGAKTRLLYNMGKREIQMIETIVLYDLPDRFSATYEADGVWNLVENVFTEIGENQTLWHLETEFKMKGFLMIFASLLPFLFKKQTRDFMDDFITYTARCESEKS